MSFRLKGQAGERSQATSSGHKPLGAIVLPPLRPPLVPAVEPKLECSTKTKKMEDALNTEEHDKQTLCSAHCNAENNHCPCKSTEKHVAAVDEEPSIPVSLKTSGSSANTPKVEDVSIPTSNAKGLDSPAFRGQVSARCGTVLHDIGEMNRLKQRRRLQLSGQRHNRPDGFVRHLLPTADSIGRQDNMGNLVPFLTLTTPDEDGTPGAGETFYLHDENQWPEVPEDYQNCHLNFDKHYASYERKGAKSKAQQAQRKAYADASKGASGGMLSRFNFWI